MSLIRRQGKRTGYICDLWLPGKGCWSFILTKLLHALALEGIKVICLDMYELLSTLVRYIRFLACELLSLSLSLSRTASR